MQVTSYYADSVSRDDSDLSELRHSVTSGVHSRLRVPADLTVVSFVRSALACMLSRGEWPAGGSARVLLASTEALTNAIEHGSPPGATVRVELVIAPERADVVVVDEGHPHGPVPRVPEHPPPPTAVRGRGLIIISRLADDFEMRPCGDGTEVSVGFVRAAGYEDGPADAVPGRATAGG